MPLMDDTYCWRTCGVCHYNFLGTLKQLLEHQTECQQELDEIDPEGRR